MIRSQILNNAYFSSANDGSLEQVLKSVGFEKGSATMHQTHSNICKIIEPKLQQTEYKCDGIVTKHQNIILSVLTADCAPILFFDQKKYLTYH